MRRIVQLKNNWSDAAFHLKGVMVGRAGQHIAFKDIASRYVAECLSDYELCWVPGRGTRAIVTGGRLYLWRSGHCVLVGRLTCPHLKAAIRRLNKLRKQQ